MTDSHLKSRILMLLENNPFPRDTRVRREARTLAAAGCSVTVIAQQGPGESLFEVWNSIRVYRYPAPPEAQGVFGYLIEYGYSMAAALLLSLVVLARHGFDIIHAHNPPDLYVVIGALYKILGKKFVFDHHDLSPEMYRSRFAGGASDRLYRWLIYFERLSCRLADHVIATNESYKKIEVLRSGIPNTKVTIVRNGPDLDTLRQVAPDPEIRDRAPLILGYVGIIGFQDDLDQLIDALAILRHQFGRTDFCCVIVGEGDARNAVMKQSEKLGLDGSVYFPGAVYGDDLSRYISSFDICLDPDTSNPYNDRCTMVKMAEYMTFGKPIVAFDLPEHRVTAEGAAVWVRPNSLEAFASAISSLMDDPERREQLGRKGREEVERRLAWRHQERNLLRVYEALEGHVSEDLVRNRAYEGVHPKQGHDPKALA